MLLKDILDTATGVLAGVHRVTNVDIAYAPNGTARTIVTVSSFTDDKSPQPVLVVDVKLDVAPQPNQDPKAFAEAAAAADAKYQGAQIVPDKPVIIVASATEEEVKSG